MIGTRTNSMEPRDIQGLHRDFAIKVRIGC